MQTEIAGLKISYANAQDLNLKVAAAREQTEKDLTEAKSNFQTLKRRASILKKFLGIDPMEVLIK